MEPGLRLVDGQPDDQVGSDPLLDRVGRLPVASSGRNGWSDGGWGPVRSGARQQHPPRRRMLLGNEAVRRLAGGAGQGVGEDREADGHDAHPHHMTEEPMKASVLIGCVLVGMGMLLQAVPPLVTVLAAQVVWGIGSKTAVSMRGTCAGRPLPRGTTQPAYGRGLVDRGHPAAGFRRDSSPWSAQLRVQTRLGLGRVERLDALRHHPARARTGRAAAPAGSRSRRRRAGTRRSRRPTRRPRPRRRRPARRA